MAEHARAIGAMLITAPSEDERVYEMAVRITRAEYAPPYVERRPWLKIRADIASGEVYLSAGVKVTRAMAQEDDGA